MYFCPFCGTLLLTEVQDTTQRTRLFCSTCRFVVGIHTNEPLTIVNSFTACNKKVAIDEDPSQTAAAAAATAARSGAAPSGAAAPGVENSANRDGKEEEKDIKSPSSQPKGEEDEDEAKDEPNWNIDDIGDGAEGFAEGNQIMTIRCQNEEPCTGNQAYYAQIQMRSADEPPTTFFRCTKCGYSWKQD